MSFNLISKNFYKFLLVSLFILFGVLGLAKSSWAEMYYVDFQNGSDVNSGILTSAPWKHSPGDPRATANANIILSPGDTIVFKGGITYSFDSGITDRITVNASGLAGNLIVYRSGHLHSPQWGISRAIIDGTNADLDYATNFTGVVSLKNYSYIKIEGLQIQYAPWVTYTGLIGWKGNSGGHIIINDVILRSNISPPNTSTTAFVGILIQGEWNGFNPTDFIITNSQIYDIGGHGIFLRAGMDTVLVENNIIHDCGPNPAPYQGDGIFIGAGGTAGPKNIIIRSNELYDFEEKGCVIIGGGNSADYSNNIIV